MLLAIRDRVQGVVVYVICAIIILPLALFGITEYIGIGSEPAAITINKSEISTRQFENAMQTNRQRLAQRFGGQIPPAFDDNDLIRQQTVRQFVNRELLEQYAAKNKYGSSADEVYRNIASTPEFQVDGEFSTEAYTNVLASQGYSKEQYEESVAKNIALGQIQVGISTSALVTDQDVNEYVRLRNQKRDFEYFTLSADEYAKKASVSDEDIQAYYEDNKENLLTDRQVSLQYIELKASDLEKDIAVDDATLQGLYDNDEIPGIADKPETRAASHILVSVEETDTPEIVAEKQAKIESIKVRAETESFADLAKELSDDAGSAPSGGKLGDVAKGMMVKPFEDALFSMAAGSVSDVVKSQFGFHIIKLDKIDAAQKPTFAAVKGKIRKAYLEQEAEKVFYEKADLLGNLTFEQSDNLDAAAEELGLTIKTTPLFAANKASGFAANPAIQNIAFSNDIVEEGNNSSVIEVAPSHATVVRLADYQPSRIKTLAEASNEVEAILVSDAAQKLMQADADLIAASSESLNALATSYGSEFKTAESAGRGNNEQTIDSDLLAESFLIGELNKTAVVDLDSGDKALVKVLSIDDGIAASLTPEEKDEIEAELLSAYGRNDTLTVRESFEAASNIVYNPLLSTSAE